MPPRGCRSKAHKCVTLVTSQHGVLRAGVCRAGTWTSLRHVGTAEVDAVGAARSERRSERRGRSGAVGAALIAQRLKSSA